MHGVPGGREQRYPPQASCAPSSAGFAMSFPRPLRRAVSLTPARTLRLVVLGQGAVGKTGTHPYLRGRESLEPPCCFPIQIRRFLPKSQATRLCPPGRGVSYRSPAVLSLPPPPPLHLPGEIAVSCPVKSGTAPSWHILPCQRAATSHRQFIRRFFKAKTSYA